METVKKNLCWLLAGITALLNVIMFFALPERVAIQVTSGGGIGNTAPTWLYLVVSAAIELLLGYMVFKSSGTERQRFTLTEVLVFAVNIVVIVLNLTVFAGKVV